MARIIKQFLFFWVCVLSLLCSAHSSDVINIEPEVFVMQNGMQVCVLKSGGIPVVSHVLLYKVGSSDEAVGFSGIAHLLEHMMFKSTESHDENYYINQLQKIGAIYNATTNDEHTTYYVTAPRKYLPLIMELEADRMQNLLINAASLQKEKEVVLEERRQRVENDETVRLLEDMNSFFYMNYPYAHPTVGWEEDINAIEPADLQSFYTNYYRPSNAILVLAGDINKQDAEVLVEKYYGKILDNKQPMQQVRKFIPELYGNVSIEGINPKVMQNKLIRFYRAPTIAQDDKKAIASHLLSYVISGKRNSPLYKHFVVKKKLASDLDASMNFYLNTGMFMFFIFPADWVGLDRLSQGLDDFLQDIARQGITQEQLDIAKSIAKVSSIYEHSNISNMSLYYAQLLAWGLPANFIKNYGNLVDSISLDYVNVTIKELFAGKFVEGHMSKGEGK